MFNLNIAISVWYALVSSLDDNISPHIIPLTIIHLYMRTSIFFFITYTFPLDFMLQVLGAFLCIIHIILHLFSIVM